MKFMILSILFFSCITWAADPGHKAHVHGAAKIALAIESDKEANIDLDVAADSIFGFEHPAKTEKDKKAQNAGLEKLRKGADKIVIFAKDLSCVVEVKNVGIEKPEGEVQEGTGMHEDVNGSYHVKCEQAISGSKVRLGIFALFPKIHKVTLEVLTSTGQSQKAFTNGEDSFDVK